MSSPRSKPSLFCHKYVPKFETTPYCDEQSRNVTWSSKICHCRTDPHSCWTTFFCPCVTFGRIAEYTDQGSSSCVAKGALYCLTAALTCCFGACCCGCCNRRKMRKRFDWEQKPCHDCSVHCFCHCCALCQEYRHLQNLGYDPSKGWEENGQMGNGSIGMTPPQRMTI
ncbi:protein PLANT CADMIUM RESISTANCE 2-like [Rhodamnia argentea]|uniref:Protein PLANT CADMIUM RESISTANCE 2-like n=1 Tax=Rhodamnia argentea TaxID=178133 RepID=A0ABM3HVS9_9MYRT|nr:protein PLANT CADMIUM RESISTANCE 2-like [Rhodamnia argentea]